MDDDQRQIPGDQRDAALARKVVERNQRFFAATRHPIYLWSAYWLCRKQDFAIPEWIYVEFDRLWGRLWDAVHEPVIGDWKRNAAYVLLGDSDLIPRQK